VDPGTAILEVAVHVGFDLLDMTPHVLTAATIDDHENVHVVRPDIVPSSNWLRPGLPSAGQQRFGDTLLNEYSFVLIPSTVSSHSWNLMFDPDRAKGFYALHLQENFSLDTRLNPPRR
jgi:RES domain-containing protein